jgi:hypothetical protein
MSDPNSTSPDILSDGPGKDLLRPVFVPAKYAAIIIGVLDYY